MDELYVNIEDPSQKRRMLLESSKDLLNSLKMIDDFLDIKKEKKELFNKLKVVFGEISALNSSFRNKFPEGFSEKNEKPVKKENIKVDFIEKSSFDKKKTKLDLIDEEISAMEDKLKRFE
jgi:hypothetical protein